MKNEIEAKLKQDNELFQELFSFNGVKDKLNHVKEMMKNSEKDPHFCMNLLDFYSLCRPNQQGVSKELIEFILSCFPEQINEIQQIVRKRDVLKFIINSYANFSRRLDFEWN